MMELMNAHAMPDSVYNIMASFVTVRYQCPCRWDHHYVYKQHVQHENQNCEIYYQFPYNYNVNLLVICLLDINECASEDTHNCEHTCVNTEGSHVCRCDDGYRLEADGYSCAGMFCLLWKII